MRPYLFIIFALITWSTWGLAVRRLDLPVPAITFYNAVFAALFQGAGLLWGSRKEKLHMGRGLPLILLLGLFSLLNIFSYFYAIKSTTVASALLTHYTAPVFVAAAAPFFLKDRMDGATLGALAASAVGLAVIFLKGQDLGGSGIIGAASGTVSGVAYAAIIIMSRALSPDHHPLKVIFYQTLLAAVLMGAFMLPSGIPAITLHQGLLLAAVGLFHSTIALCLYLYGIRQVTAQEAGVLGYLEPFFGIILALFFLDERPGALAITGGMLIILSGMAVVMRGRRPVAAGGIDDSRG